MFVSMRGVAWSKAEVSRALQLSGEGLSDYEVSRRTGIPRGTVLNWRRGLSLGIDRAEVMQARCNDCGAAHELESLNRPAYAYLLGQYLGDGCIWKSPRNGVCVLRISSDAQYPGIIDECCAAISAVRGRRPYVRPDPMKRLVTITSYWRAWICLFPQHGRGRKHHRPIVLSAWQESIVDDEPERFLRGLIHSDGWRGLNRVHVKGKDYEYPRYQFSNRSQDIKKLFTDACERLGIEWRRWGTHHISVARRQSVALMDEFIGPKY
jgi:hypothetical protein